MFKEKKHNILVLSTVLVLSLISLAIAADVGKWKRFEVSFPNSTWSGNPFDLAVEGAFTHTSSGETKTVPGFYAGNSTWKIFFMPYELGEWTYSTQSPDSDLNNKTGSFNCIPSGLPGKLTAVPGPAPRGNRWKREDMGYVAPILVQVYLWFREANGHTSFDEFLPYAIDTLGAPIILNNFGVPGDHSGYAPKDYSGDVWSVYGEEFNITMFDRMNQRYDALRDNGMGGYFMLYDDDRGTPGFGGQSLQEIRYFKYMVARFSCYPVVIWDSGIDISEYRSNSWCDWLADWFNQNDPYNHPIGSRSGGGSGGKNPNNASYYSDGENDIVSYSTMISFWNNRSLPTAFTDIWCIPGHGGTKHEIRQALWELGLVGGTAVSVGPDYTMDRSLPFYDRLLPATYMGHAARFFKEEIMDLGKLDPHVELVKSGDLVLAADPGKEYVGYLKNGGACSIDLSNITGSATLKYYDPKTGDLSSGTSLQPSANTIIPAPSFSGDAVIWIFAEGSDTVGLDTENQARDGNKSRDVSIQVYPNPFNTRTTIYFPNLFNGISLNVFTIIGRLVFSQKNVDADRLVWNTRDLPSGVYILKSKMGNRQYIKKLFLWK